MPDAKTIIAFELLALVGDMLLASQKIASVCPQLVKPLWFFAVINSFYVGKLQKA